MPTRRSAKAWILTGGWPGHDPEGVAYWTAERIAEAALEAEVVRDLDALLDADALDALALLVPNWSLGSLTAPQERGLVSAVERGLGLAGTHGGMGDAFRDSLAYQWLVGGSSSRTRATCARIGSPSIPGARCSATCPRSTW